MAFTALHLLWDSFGSPLLVIFIATACLMRGLCSVTFIAALLAFGQSYRVTTSRRQHATTPPACTIGTGPEVTHCTSEIPKVSTHYEMQKLRNPFYAGALATALASILVVREPLSAAAADSTESTYKDSANGFSLLVEPGWSIMPRKTPTATMLQFQPEEVLFTGSRFNEGGGASSLSVTRTNAARLLKDFDVEWWFAPLNNMGDLGSAELISGLLILQRQGEFEKRESPSSVKNAKIVDNVLTFDFTTPLGSIYVRRTDAKAYFRDNKLIVVWISALTTFWEGEYGKKLDLIKDSFKLEEVVKRTVQ